MTLQRKNCLSKKKKKLSDPKGRPLEKIQKNSNKRNANH